MRTHIALSMTLVYLALISSAAVGQEPGYDTQSIQRGAITFEKITNDSPTPMVAFRSEWTCPGGRASGSYNYDSLSRYGTFYPIPYGASIEIPDRFPAASKCSFSVRGVLFADGRLGGDPSTLNDIREMRQGALYALTILKSLMQEAVDRNISTADLVPEVQASIEKLMAMGPSKATEFDTEALFVF